MFKAYHRKKGSIYFPAQYRPQTVIIQSLKYNKYKSHRVILYSGEFRSNFRPSACHRLILNRIEYSTNFSTYKGHRVILNRVEIGTQFRTCRGLRLKLFRTTFRRFFRPQNDTIQSRVLVNFYVYYIQQNIEGNKAVIEFID